MKRLILIVFLIVFALGTAHGQALKRVPKNNKNDSSKTDTVTRQDNKGVEKVVARPETEPRKDEFIDRDGDGVNDNIRIQKPPEIKKPIQAEPPKVEKPEMSPPPAPPSNPPAKISQPEQKESPKVEPTKKESSASSKKTKR